MRALVVGAGAVGQVYGRHLSRGGADVAFLVKPEHVEESRAGFTLYHLNRPRRRRREPERFTGYRVYETATDVVREPWDQVYLTMSSTALRAGAWFAELATAVGGATIVLLQPGPEDRAFVVRHVPEEQVVQGILLLISYRVPLPGETRFAEPGIAYWFPPLAASPMSGSPARRDPVVTALRRGGLPTRTARDVSARGAFGAAVMMPLLAVLESVDWSLDELRRGEHLGRGVRASREALNAVAHHRARRPPFALRLAARQPVVRVLLRLAPLVMPLNLETYLHGHFTKVGDQTRDFLRTYLEWGRGAGAPIDDLARVSDEVADPALDT